jgi:hypothetical protein
MKGEEDPCRRSEKDPSETEHAVYDASLLTEVTLCSRGMRRVSGVSALGLHAAADCGQVGLWRTRRSGGRAPLSPRRDATPVADRLTAYLSSFLA